MSADQSEIPPVDNSAARFSDLRAIYLNSTLKLPHEQSHTALLLETSAAIMRRHSAPADHAA
jgi:hypothetical protein